MNQNWIKRMSYLEQLIQWKDHKVVKVITGIRRSGKSTLLNNLFTSYLLSHGVRESQIISINLESIDNEHLYNYKSLYEHITDRLKPNEMNYVIIDEVQNATNFQKAIDSLYIKDNVDIYITGSNAFMLSGELATLLSGRYVTIEVLPLSFSEYLSSLDATYNIDVAYRDYIKWGGFPYVTQLNKNEASIRQYLEGIYNTILKKDIIIRNRVSDIFVLEDVIRYVFDNIGNILSSKKISDTLTSSGKKISRPTIDTYLGYLINGYAVYKVQRYDIKGKEYLKSLEKYYVTDIGLRHYLLGFRNINHGHLLENIVFLELKRRGFEIYIGKYDNKEIDFVAKDSKRIIYIQVVESMKSIEAMERELSPLKMIRDYNPRVVLTRDYDLNASYDGIQVLNVLEWLTKEIDF